MFDIGWSELFLIGIVALIVVGPKDLPKLFHALGQFTAKARSMARDFQRAMEQAARDAGVDDVANVAKDMKSMTSPRAMGLDALSSASKKFDAWDQTKRAAAGAAGAGEHAAGSATAELAAQVQANAEAAEAKAAELAALRNQPTPEELAEAAHEPGPVAKPARKPRAKTVTAPAPEAAKEPAKARSGSRATVTQPASAPEAGPAETPAKRRVKAEPAARPNGAAKPEAVPAPKPKRKRAAPRKSDA